MTVAHPKSLNEITATWMTGALSSCYPGIVVSVLRPSTVISGTATKARFELDYATGKNRHGLPASLWIKGGFEAHSANTSAGNRNEANFFRDIAPLLNCNCATSFYQSVDPETGEGLVLLEDLLLRNATFGQLTQTLTPQQVADVLDIQAHYHAVLWDKPELKDYTWLSNGGFIIEDGVVDYFFSLWDVSETMPRFQFVTPALRRQRDKLKASVIKMLEINRAQARSIVHGDTHMGNLFFDGNGKPGYLDWQTIMRGCWAFDFAPFLVTAMSVEERRKSERELLRYYLDRLWSHGAKAPTFDEAWLAYRQFVLWTFMFAMCPTQYQSEENCCAVIEKSCAALTDLDTLSAFD